MKQAMRDNTKRILRIPLFLLILGITTLFGVQHIRGDTAFANSALKFNAANIMSDQVMRNKSSMSVSQVQSFLNAKGVNCTSGSNCLKNYRQNNKSAAQIIYETGQRYNINPQVLIVLLQKEVGIVTMNNPESWRYRTAAGYGCPDSTPGVCDSSYYGFSNQMKWAATMFDAILRNSPTWYAPYVVGQNNILLHPYNNCGTQRVNIQNRATAALYSYTPYVPNQAALNAGYGTGDRCSSYGNRNFFTYFTDWFGSTQGGIAISNISFEAQPFTNKQARAIISIKNTSKTTINLGRIKIEARGSNNAYYQTPSVSNLSIKPGATYTFKQPITIAQEGNFTFTVARYANNAWISPPFSDFGVGISTQKTVHVTMEPTVTQSLTLPEGNQHINAPITATFKVKNNSTTQAANIGRMKIQGNLNGTQYDFPSTENNLTISAGQTYTYSKQFTPTRSGVYTFTMINNRSDYGWKTNFPTSLNSSIVRSATVTVKDSVTVTQPLVLSTSNARQGENITATFSMRNFSTKSVNIGRMKIQGMHSDGTQYDFPSTPDNLVLQPGATYNYSQSRTLPKTGSYAFKIMNFREKERWSASYPMNEEESIKRNAVLSIDNATTVTEDLQFSRSSIHQNEAISATFAVKNHSNKAVAIGRTKVECLNGTTQLDFDSTVDNLTIAAGATYEYTATKAFPSTGTWSCKLVNYRQKEGWSTNFPVSENSSIIRNQDSTVKQPVTVMSSLGMSKSSALRNEAISATFAVKNHSNKAVAIGRTKVECLNGTTQLDFDSTVDNLTIAAGATYEYTATKAFPSTGTWSCKLVNYRQKEGWSTNFPVSENASITRLIQVAVR